MATRSARAAREASSFPPGWPRLAALALVVVTVLVSAVGVAPAAAEDPTFVAWSDLLPGISSVYDPAASNLCAKGSVKCVDAVIKEMTKRFNPLVSVCDHNAMFSLTYLRTTEEYRRTIEDDTFFSDTAFINHQDALFGSYYFNAWDDYRAGRLASVPQAWQIAFAAADGHKVSGSGNLFLGMSAHVNRDLPYVLADIGLVKPDGSSRKPDHDKVNQFLNRVIEPLLAEAGRRLDPTVESSNIQGTTMDETGTMQLLVAWREQAWRNAEALVNAPTAASRALVAQQIETTAAIEAQLLVASTAYSAADAGAAQWAASSLNATAHLYSWSAMQGLLSAASQARQQNVLNGLLPSSGAATRDAYCASHWNT
ncbi:MAG: hypothetical protein QOI47_653 [Actinomycetota bacterium]|nr:hypothetical protein [Actinomycetota bacterium]